jgi:competence protein ComEC
MPCLSLAFTTALLVGLAGGVIVDLGSLWLPSIVLAGGWVLALVAFERGFARTQLASLAASAIAAGWLLGSAAVDRALNPPLRVLLDQHRGGFAIGRADEGRHDEPIGIEGRLRADATPTESGVLLRIDVERIWLGAGPEPAAGGVAVTVGGALHAGVFDTWTAGRTVRASAALRRPARYMNHGLADQERAMARRGVALVGTIKSAALVELVERGRWWEEAAAAVRRTTRAAVNRHLSPRDTQAAAIATAILIGDRAAIAPAVERRLQEAGTYHVIAISGGNIAILAGLALGVLGGLGLRGRTALLLTIAALACYALIASGGASVARATLMASLYLAVRLLDHRTAAANAIALSAAALLLANPLTVVDVGFWLTFGATSAIIVGVARVGQPSARWRAAIVTLLAASICAELALAPIAALVFERVTLAGLLLNFVAIPCMTVVQVGAMGLVAFDAVGAWTVAAWCASIVHLAARGLTDSTLLLDLAPWLAWRVPPPLPFVLACYYAALALWWRGDGRARVVTLALFLWIVVAPTAHVRAHGDGSLHLTMMDVGQGDSVLATFPNGRTLVVDTGGVSRGGGFDIGDRVIGPVLRARQLLALDYLAVTHGDPDHIGGALALVRDFAPREVWWGTPVERHAPTALVHAEASTARAAWRTLQRGDRLEIGGVELRVHHPAPPDWERQKVRNSDSLVLELRYGDVSMLLTGDIGREIEEELLPTLDLLPTVVLKVPHHGSGTSSSDAFVEKVRPVAALIGVGRGNIYGHPVPHVLDRYTRVGTEVFRTDRDGQIDVSTDGARLSVRTYVGRVWSMR